MPTRRPPHTIRLEGPGAAPRSVPVEDRQTIIGRGTGAGVRLQSPRVSRHHAEIVRDPFGQWWIRDLGSANGTRVNGQGVTERVITPADIIEIGEFRLWLEAAAEPGGAAGPPGEPGGDLGRLASWDEAEAPGGVQSLGELGAPRIDPAHLFAMTDLGRELIRMEDGRQRLHRLCESMVHPTLAGRVAVVLRLARDASGQPPRFLCEPQAGSAQDAEALYLSRSLLEAVRHQSGPVMASNRPRAGEAMELTLDAGARTLSIIACPIHRHARHLDVLYTVFPAEYGTAEWLALVALACRQFEQARWAAIARRENQAKALIEKELEQARAVQERLIPRHSRVPGLRIALGYEPCRWTGGDYVDVIPAPDGRVLAAVADVCGKGLQAALVTSSLHAMLHAGIQGGSDLPELARSVNDYLCRTVVDHAFVTMALMMLEPASGTFSLVNAGHLPPLVLAPGAAPERLQASRNIPMGIEPGPLEAQAGRLPAGGILALYTDGLTELRDDAGRMLGIDRFAGALDEARQAGAEDPGALHQRILELVSGHQGRQMAHDDRAWLLIRAD